jgi:APA family basic amino acid/polyamine antiporter
VCGGVWYLRVKEPNRPRPFKTPFVPLFPILGIASCLYLMTGLPGRAWSRLFIWLALGMVIYFLYGRRHSVVQRTGDEAHGGLQEPPRPTYTDDKDGR